MTAEEKAALLITEIDNALKRGTLHFRKSDGKLLTTTREILETILAEGKITFRPVESGTRN